MAVLQSSARGALTLGTKVVTASDREDYERELFHAVKARLRSSEDYVRYQMLLAEPLFRRMRAFLPSGRLRVLEVGCGTGGVSLYLASQGCKVAAIDRQQYDSTALRVTRDFAVSHAIELDVYEADAAALPFGPETFDCVVCNNVIEHLEDPGSALEEIHRVLKPAGVAFVDFPLFRNAYGGHIESSVKIPWFHLLPRAWVVAELRRRGAERDLAVFLTLSGITNARFRRIVRRVGLEIVRLRRAHYLTNPGRKLAASLLEAARRRSLRRALQGIREAASDFSPGELVECAFLLSTVPLAYAPMVGEYFASGVKYVLRKPGLAAARVGEMREY